MATSDFEIRNMDPRQSVSFELNFTRGLNRARMSRGVVREPVRLGPGERYRFRARLGLAPNRAKEVCDASPDLLKLKARGIVDYGPWPYRVASKPEKPAKPAKPAKPRQKLAGEPALLHRQALETGHNPEPLPSAGHGNNASPEMDPHLFYVAAETIEDAAVEAPLDPEETLEPETSVERDPNERPDATWKLQEIVDWADDQGLDLNSTDKRTKQKALRAIAREAD